MKTKIIAIIGLATASFAFAGSTTEKCPMPPASECFMMPSTQHSKANLVWIGPACCVPADNITADVSSLNSKHAVLSVGGATAEKIGTTTIVYSEKGGDFRVKDIQVTR